MTRSIAIQNQPRRRKPVPPTPPPRTAPPPPPAVEIAVDSPSDSDYETDTSAEPEEFYISLDLTIPTPIHAGPSSNPHANAAPPSTLPPPLPLSSTTRSGRSGRRHIPPTNPSASPPATTVTRWASGDAGRLQLLDLHTDTPLVSFSNRIWSGSWMGSVGTELFIRCPEGPAPEDTEEVRGVYVSQKDTSAAAAATTGAVVDGGVEVVDPEVGRVVAMADTRIHCHPAVVTAKQRREGRGDAERTYGWRPGKSTFLERLEAIQVARGERRGGSSSSSGSEEETAFQERVDEQGEEQVRVEKKGYFAKGWEGGKDPQQKGDGMAV